MPVPEAFRQAVRFANVYVRKDDGSPAFNIGHIQETDDTFAPIAAAVVPQLAHEIDMWFNTSNDPTPLRPAGRRLAVLG